MKSKFVLLLVALSLSAGAQEILTLGSALQTGLQNNFSIVLQNNNVQVLKNNNTAGNAGMLPSLGWTAAQNNTVYTTHQESFSGTVKDVRSKMNTSLNSGLQLNWTLFDGMNMFVNRQTLGMMQQIGENQSRIVVENSIVQIARLYYNIIQLKKVIEVDQDAVNLSLERKKIAEAQLALGSGDRQQLLQSTVDLNADSSQLKLQLLLLQNAKSDLNYLLARDAATPFDIIDSIRLMNLASCEDIVAKAMTQNSELLAAKMDQHLSELDVKSAQSERYPKLNLQSGYNFILQKSQTGFAKFNQSYGPYFGLTASCNIFNGSNTSREIRNARIMLNNSEITVRQASLDIRTSILKLYNSYTTSLELVRLEAGNINAAQQNVDMAFAKYKLGTITDIELREVQKKLLDAQYLMLQAQFDAKNAEIELMQLSGDLIGLF